MSALHRFIQTKHDIKELRELIRGGEDPNSKDHLQRTPLHIAVLRCENNPQFTNEILLVVRELIKLGANVDEGESVDMTPLHMAVISKNLKMIEALLQANADLEKKECRGWTALHFATRKSHRPDLAILKLILKYNPDINSLTKHNETPLMFAVNSNDLYIVLELLKKKASVKKKDTYGETAMHYALKQPEVNVKIVFELLKRGCSFNKASFHGFTARENYLEGLCDIQSSEKMCCAVEIIKLFVLDKANFTQFESECILRFESTNYGFGFHDSLELFQNAIEKMKTDKLASSCTVYDIAHRGVFRRTNANHDRFTSEVFDSVLNKLMRGEYPDYSDIIVLGICSSYINRKFTEMLSNTVSDIKIFEHDLLKIICKYLEKSEKLNMMIVCREDI